MPPTTVSSSVTWTWSPWMTATCTAVVTSPATLPLPWTSLVSGEGSLLSWTQTLCPDGPHCTQHPFAPGPCSTLSPTSSLSLPLEPPEAPPLTPALLCHRLPYAGYFGGVSGLSKAQFLRINGFPNEYWGWGGEDDDIFNR